MLQVGAKTRTGVFYVPHARGLTVANGVGLVHSLNVGGHGVREQKGTQSVAQLVHAAGVPRMHSFG